MPEYVAAKKLSRPISKPSHMNNSLSILQRLRKYAQNTNRRPNELFRYFAIERFLYRLSLSKHASRFFLKGGLMLKAWQISRHRATLDIDLLGKTSNTLKNIQKIIEDICKKDVVPDGVRYETSDLQLKEIQLGREYHGLRAIFSAYLHSTKIPIQLDIGFSDIILPKPLLIHYPTILEFPSPHIYGYTPESVVAEKFEAMMKLGLINTRMKDFFDIWILLRQLQFDGLALQQAIEETCKRRQTSLTLPDSFNPVFYNNPVHQSRWLKLLQSIENDFSIPLSQAISEINEFLQPLLKASQVNRRFKKTWTYSQKWNER